MKQTLNIAMIGGGFMGKAHSNAWLRVGQFFQVPVQPKLKVIAGHRTSMEAFAARWGYEEITYDWRTLLERDDIDIVDIVTPPYEHKEMVLAFLKKGVHIVCEKPFTLTAADALECANAAKEAGVVHYLNHNYRRIPAVTYAKQLIEEGRLGQIYHWRGAYLQDWIMDPAYPLGWHLQKELAGGGASYDIASHAIDLARYMIGDPLALTAVNKTFIHERPLPQGSIGAFSGASATAANAEMGAVTVDDASFSILEFQNGALGSIEATRFAGGRKNANMFEVYGSRGSLMFNLEQMNELFFWDGQEPLAEQGYRKILVTEATHPYLCAWWPTGHIIGYEHTFVNAFYDFLQAVCGGAPMQPDFTDGWRETVILEGILRSSQEQKRVVLEELR